MSRKKAEAAVTIALIFGLVMLAQQFTQDWRWMLLAAGLAGAFSVCVVELALRRIARRKSAVVENA